MTTKTHPVLLHVLNSNSEPVAVQATGTGLNVTILDRSDAVQHCTTGTVAASGDNTALAAPGSGLQYLICKLQVQSQGSNAVNILVKAASDELWRAHLPSAGSGIILDFEPPDRLTLGDNQPLIINLDAAETCNYSVQWYAVAV